MLQEMIKNLALSSKNNIVYLFLISLIYSLLISFFIQDFLLVDFYSNYVNHKEIAVGLVVPDSIGFHNKAIEVYYILSKKGLSAWSLFYQANFQPSF